MGMIAMFRRLSDADLTRLRAKPELVADYLGGDEPEGFGPFADLDVDKAWHAIHFLLTGSAWNGDPPLNFIVVGGVELSDDMGYGPARGLSSGEVRNLATALKTLPPNALLQRFAPAALTSAEIYLRAGDEGVGVGIPKFGTVRRRRTTPEAMSPDTTTNSDRSFSMRRSKAKLCSLP